MNCCYCRGEHPPELPAEYRVYEIDSKPYRWARNHWLHATYRTTPRTRERLNVVCKASEMWEATAHG